MRKAKEGKRKQISKYELLMKHAGEDSAYGDLADAAEEIARGK